MSIKEQLQNQMKQAMKDKNKEKLATIRLTLSAIKNKEIKLKTKELSESDELEVIKTEVNQTKESLEFAQSAGKTEAVEELNARLELLVPFLPAQLTDEEVQSFIQGVITENNFSGRKDMGKVMAIVMPELKHKADGKLVNKTVQELLS